MRTLKLTLLAALTLVLGAATASASSVDVIWQISGTNTTIVASASSIVTGNIILTVGVADTAIGGVGAGIELSADYGPSASVVGSVQTVLTSWFPLATGPDDGISHYENVLAQGDLFGSGVSLMPGTSTVLGTITVHVGNAPLHSVTVSNSGLGDDIITAGGVSLLGQFTFGAGTITHIPEPTTASLLGLGLLGLTVAGRQPKS